MSDDAPALTAELIVDGAVPGEQAAREQAAR
jgi:hypothetical protein